MKHIKNSFKQTLAALLALIMVVTSFPLTSLATVEGNRPADGRTEGQPFIANQPSETYRIPAMVSLDDGTIVAVSDARWDGAMDGGGNDTIVARSTDGGDSWDNQFVTHYPDNGDVFNKASTGVCDSELVTDGKNIWMLTVFFPAGWALNGASANNQLQSNNGTAFVNVNGTDRVKLTNNGGTSYDYYIGDFDKEGADGRATIYALNSNTATAFSVDHDYYIYENGVKQNANNLFYSDGTFQTAKVNFLLLRKSTDGGQSWSSFTPINVKNPEEAFFGVGPGRGVYDKAHNRIIFSTYTWNGSNNSQRSSFIYSDNDGKTWKRSADFPSLDGAFSGNWSSESTLVQLDDNTLRCFIRNGWNHLIYADAIYQPDGSYQWTAFKDVNYQINGPKSTFGTSSGCQLSAIKYSKKLQYNGQYCSVILLSTPYEERKNGVVYTIVLDDSNNIINTNDGANKAISYSLSSGYFGYSCLTELPDGSIVDLFEINEARNITFSKLPSIEKITGLRVPNSAKTYNYTLPTGSSEVYLTDGKDETANSLANIKYDERISVNGNLGNSTAFDGVSIPLSDALYDFKSNTDGTWSIGAMGVYLSIVEPLLPSSVTKTKIKIIQDGEYFKFLRDNEAMAFWRSGDKIYQYDQTTAYGGAGSDGETDRAMCLFEVYRLATASENKGAGPVPGFVRVTDINEIKDGGQYIIGCEVNGSHYFLYPSTSQNNTYSHTVKMNPTPVSAGYYMTVKPYKPGNLTLHPGMDTYNFEFVDYSNEILGVVNYDPVIYTHGTDSIAADMSFTHVGNQIADGTYEGERETCFRFNTSEKLGDLSAEYRIVSVAAIPDGSTNPVQLEYTYDEATKEYKLKGKLDLANTNEYTDFTKGQYATVKTTLEEIDTNKIYTQTDRLYVTSNPVPGHIVSGMNHEWREYNFPNYNYKWQPFCTYILAPGSIGNTINLKDISNYAGNNAKHIYTWNRNSDGADGFTYYNDITNLTQSNTADDIKKPGIIENYRNYGWGTNKNPHENYILSDDLVFNKQLIMGYYYYDKSSPKNDGVTNITNNGNSFSIELQRKAVDINFATETTNPVPIIIGGQNSTNRSTFNTYLGADRSIIGKIRGDASASITTKTYDQVFGSGSYNTRENGQPVNGDLLERTATADCTINAQPNQKGSLTGVLRYQEGREDFTERIWNDIVFPFEVKYCDKSVERDAYNNSIKDVLKSTDFTTTTWDAYMNKALVYQEYLNNYIIQTREEYNALNPDNNLDSVDQDENIPDSYKNIQKRADFNELLDQLAEKQEIIDNGIEISNDKHYTPDSFENLGSVINENQALYDSAGINGKDNGGWIGLDGQYTADEVRSEIPGWDIGPYNENKTEHQIKIDNGTDSLKNATPKIAADDDVYIAVKNEFDIIDKTAYEDNGAEINDVFVAGDTNFYKPYNGKSYVNVPEDEQAVIDAAIRDALNKMNVGLNSDTENPNKVKTYNIKVYVNNTDTPVFDNNYRYGYVLDYDFAQHFTSLDTQAVKCVAYSDRNGNVTQTTLNLEDYADTNYVVPVLIQNDMIISLTVTDNATANQLVVKDYYGTVIGILNGTEVTIAGDTVTVGDQTITAKLSPRYDFKGWSLKDGTYPITEGMVISQIGKFISMGNTLTFTVDGGTVNDAATFNSQYLNVELKLASDNAKYWTRTVLDDTGNVMIPESLASYEKDFMNFTSGQNVHYKAYADVDSLPDELRYKVQSDTPAINGVGYCANGKFTLSVDYSASENVNVLDSGIIFSTVSGDDLVKGGKDAQTYPATRIAHWTNNPNSGTFTMSTSANFDVAYLRSYVSYTKTYGDTDLPYVTYSDVVYKCEKQEDGSYVVVPMI